jgi:nucleoside-diphosphate-sugar epimerase
MRIFVTGGTGYIGSAVVQALVRAGHRVTGVARTPEKDDVLRKLGAEPVRGALGSLKALEETMAAHDAIVHTAVDWTLGPAADREAIEAMVAAARRGGPRALVYTSGVWVLGATPRRERFDEGALVNQPAGAVAWRPGHERMVLETEIPNVRTAVIRPGIVFGEKRGLVSTLFESAVKTGAAEFVGDGGNRWAFVHRDDLAELYRLVVERNGKGIFHGVDGASPTLGDAAKAASAAAGKGGAVRPVPVSEARRKLGGMAEAMTMDQVVVSVRAGTVGWQPKHPPFVQDAGAAFREWSAP